MKKPEWRIVDAEDFMKYFCTDRGNITWAGQKVITIEQAKKQGVQHNYQVPTTTLREVAAFLLDVTRSELDTLCNYKVLVQVEGTWVAAFAIKQGAFPRMIYTPNGGFYLTDTYGTFRVLLGRSEKSESSLLKALAFWEESVKFNMSITPQRLMEFLKDIDY